MAKNPGSNPVDDHWTQRRLLKLAELLRRKTWQKGRNRNTTRSPEGCGKGEFELLPAGGLAVIRSLPCSCLATQKDSKWGVCSVEEGPLHKGVHKGTFPQRLSVENELPLFGWVFPHYLSRTNSNVERGYSSPIDVVGM